MFADARQAEPHFRISLENYVWSGENWPTYEEAKNAIDSHPGPQSDEALVYIANIFRLDESWSYMTTVRTRTGSQTSLLKTEYKTRIDKLSEALESEEKYRSLGKIARRQAAKDQRAREKHRRSMERSRYPHRLDIGRLSIRILRG